MVLVNVDWKAFQLSAPQYQGVTTVSFATTYTTLIDSKILPQVANISAV